MSTIKLTRDQVIRLWLSRQGLLDPRGRSLTRQTFLSHLKQTGALQLDSVNVVDRAHHLTLWSRFGSYDRDKLSRWSQPHGPVYEFWGHEASLRHPDHLPLSRRGMKLFNPGGKWWNDRKDNLIVRRRVLRRIRAEGPLESADFKTEPGESGGWWGWKDEKMALEWLWRQGRLAVCGRRHFRRRYDLAERVYPESQIATRGQYEDSWLMIGLSGNGVAPAAHLDNYITAPRLKAADRRRVIARNLKLGSIVQVEVEGFSDPWYTLPEFLPGIKKISPPRGTNLICPFDSLLWQRQRARDLLNFNYRIEIYTPREKRVFGYYVLPIMHDGKLVGRLDPKLDRQSGTLLIHAIHLEDGFTADHNFKTGLAGTLEELGEFLGATTISLPRGWRQLI
jgi:uncharacterized protein